MSRMTEVLAEAAWRMHRVATVDGVSEAVLRAAAGVFPAYDHASFWSLGRDGSVGPHSSTSVLALDLDTASVAAGEGPTLHSMRSAAVVAGSWLADNGSWPAYGPRAARSGVRCQLSVPLPEPNAGEETEGASCPATAISLFSTTVDVVAGRDVDLAQLFALHAATALARARDAEHAARSAGPRELVARASGIVEERYQVDEVSARILLLRTAHARGATVDLVADEIVAELGRHATTSESAPERRRRSPGAGVSARSVETSGPAKVAGWYRDGSDPRGHRYWTGDSWRPDGGTAPPFQRAPTR